MSDGRVVINITGDTSGYERSVRELASRTQKSLSSVSGALGAAGSALTKGITVPALGAATAVGSIFAVKGWQRLEAIDTAKSKLKGLGYTAGDIESIMGSALTSVKGTAYGLGDAATVAVGALASGVTKGEDLTRVLKTIGDVATIAGGDFSGVATVFNKVMSKGKLMGDEILQLSERGVPVLQILAKHLGTTAEEVSELASEGEISFATFEEAMRSAFGGAALASGESMRGTIENTWAAVSRVGAAFLEGGEKGQGFFNVLKPLLGELTADIDGMSSVAGEWGAAFGGVVLDTVDVVRDLVGAFNELTPSEKRQVAELVAIAVAAGPVLKIGSKLVSGAGALVGVLGKSAGVSNKVIASARGLGSVYAQNVRQQNNWLKVMGQGETVYYRWNKATQTYTKTNSSLRGALLSTSAGHRAQAAAATMSTKAMEMGKTAARGLGGALKAIAPLAIVGGLIALGTYLMDCAAKTERQTAATAGLEAAASGATIAIDDESGSIETLGSAAASLDVDRITQERSISDANQSMVASTGMLSDYGDTISSLAGRSDLSAEEIAALKIAVDGVNSSCGTSYTVAKDAEGAWQIMADGAIVAKDAILSLIDAQLAQIRAEAEAENYKSAYEQLAKDAESLASAQGDVATKQEAYNKALEAMQASGADAWMDGTAQAAAAAETELKASKDALSSIEGQMGATQSAANRLTEQMKLTAMASAEGAGEILKLVDGNLAFKAAVQQTGTDLVAFTQTLQDVGFTAEQVAAMTPKQAAAMAQGWKGGADEMVRACEDLGIEVPEALRAMGEQARAQAEASGQSAGQGLTAGLSAEAQNAVNAALTTVGLTVDEFDKLAAEAGIEGDEAAVAFANAIALKQGQAQQAGTANANAAKSGMGGASPVGVGNAMASKFAQALGSAKSQNASQRSGKADATAGHEGISSRNDEFETSGRHAGDNWATGLRGAIDAISSAAQAAAAVAASVLRFSVPAKGPFSGAEQGGKRSGRHLIQNIAAGMLSERSSLAAAAFDAADLLYDSLDRLNNQAHIPALEVPVGLTFKGESLDALSAFGFSAALEDRSGRTGAGFDVRVDLSPVTDALGRIEERIDAAAERTEEAYRQPVEVKVNKKTFGRAVRDAL